MCGIAGLLGLRGQPVEAELVRRMCAALAHRGPDDEGLEQPTAGVVLGHRRLSIIDVEGGHQPLCNEDGTVWVTFNGEIFNYRELRRELLAKGHRFRTRSDTEVLVHLYEEWGTSCLERINGQFAFALWDGERLFCARDPLGIKPLYYYDDGERFAFASEPRAFFAIPGIDLSIDLHALHLYFRYHYIPSPYSAYRNVRKLRPGEALTVGRRSPVTTHIYWDLISHPVEDLDDVESCRESLREKLESAVEAQMAADFPVGAFLSGGVDSSTVVALMQRHASEPVRTFAIGFPEKDEREHAGAVARSVGTHHCGYLLGHEEAAETMTELLDHIDEPAGDTSLIPTHVVSRLARRHTKVALSGDGGDELFAGYGHVRALQSSFASPPRRALSTWAGRRMRSGFDPEVWARADTSAHPDWAARILAELEDRRHEPLYGPALREAALEDRLDPVQEEIRRHERLPPLAQVLAIDIRTRLADRLLAKLDRASMQASLEVRVPFLDAEFVRFALRLAPAVRLPGGRPKGLVREAMRGMLPDSVFDRRKQGFGAPLKYWFGEGLAGFAAERLRESVGVEEGLLDRRGIDALLTARRRGKVSGPRIWRVLVLESWLRSLREGRFP